MKAYILSIAGAVLLSAVVTAIAPNGKMGKFIKGTLKLLVLTVLLAPMISLTTGKDFSLESSELAQDEGYLSACVSILEESDAKEISDYLLEEFSVETEVSSQRGTEAGFPVKKIRVNITDFGINGQVEHKDIISKIQGELEKKFGCPTEVF